MKKFEKEEIKIFQIDNGHSVMRLTGMIMNSRNIGKIRIYNVFFIERKKYVNLSELSVEALTS